MNSNVAPSIHPAVQIAGFTKAVYEPGDLVEIRAIRERGRAVQAAFVAAAAVVDHVAEIGGLNRDGMHIYIGANPRNKAGGTSGDVACARCLFIDIDNAPCVDDAIERVATSGLPWPTAIVNSGHGLHAYWRLAQPMTDLAAWQRAQKQLIARLNSDPAIHDPPRIMRLPGFMNHKPPAKPCVLYHAGDERYELAQIIDTAAIQQSLPVPNREAPAATADGQERLCRHWLGRALAESEAGSRNQKGMWLACQLRDAGISQEMAAATMQRYAERVEQPDPSKPYTVAETMATLQSAYSRPAREPAPIALGEAADDPPILPLDDAGELPEITPDALPGWAAQYAKALAAATEVSITLPTLLMLPVIASTCQRRYIIDVEGSYAQPLCLYAAAALESGERKTAIYSPIVKPLFEVQRGLQRDAKAKAAKAQVERQLAEKEIKQLEREYAQVSALGDEAEKQRLQGRILKLAMANQEPAGLPQLVAEDFTVAALGVALAANGESLLVASDEGGMFDNLLGRFSEVPDLDLFLRAHDGANHTINRTGRDNIYLNRTLLSVALSPQPGVVAKLGQKEGFVERGLLARFLWAFPRSRVGHRTLAPVCIDPNLSAAYNVKLAAMAQASLRFDADEPLRLRLDGRAHDIWKSFQCAHEPRMGPQGDLQGAVKSWASKLAGAVARIAGVCHIAAYAGQPGMMPCVSPELMAFAVETGRRLIPHAVEAHRLILGGGCSIAAAVVRYFNAEGWPRQPQSHTEWWRQLRRFVGESSAGFEPVARTLLDRGYLIECESPEPRRNGRPPRYYRANRRLHDFRARNPPETGK